MNFIFSFDQFNKAIKDKSYNAGSKSDRYFYING